LALAKAGFVLGIKPVSALRPHEETIPAHVKGLSAEIMREGVQKDPIIVDQDSLTVLDGMHRLAAFGSLGIENAVCCSLDYSSRAVTLGRWARVYSAKGGAVLEKMRQLEFTRRKTLAEAFEALDGRDSGVALLTSNAAYLPEGDLDLGRAFDLINELDGMAESNGWKRSFVPEDDIDISLQLEGNVVLLVRKLRKDDVVNAGKSGRLFPCKTSMHRIDPRPVAVNFPIGELNKVTSSTLRKRLENRKEQLLPTDSLYGGRRYKERLLLLNPE
jgi:L-serine kinase (ADP)